MNDIEQLELKKNELEKQLQDIKNQIKIEKEKYIDYDKINRIKNKINDNKEGLQEDIIDDLNLFKNSLRWHKEYFDNLEYTFSYEDLSEEELQIIKKYYQEKISEIIDNININFI